MCISMTKAVIVLQSRAIIYYMMIYKKINCVFKFTKARQILSCFFVC